MSRTPGRGRVYKPYRNGKRSEYWYIQYVDAKGQRRQKKCFKYRRATEKYLHKLLEAAEREAAGIVPLHQEALQKPIEQHVADFLLDKKADGNSPKELKKKETRLTRVLEAMGINTFTDITDAKVKEFMLTQKESGGLAKKTRNEYLSLLKGFMTWLATRYGWPNPLGCLKREKGADGVTFRRFALTEEQIPTLLRAARERGVKEYLKTHPHAKPRTPRRLARLGMEREMIYRVGMSLGLRVNEIRTLTWECLRLEASPPTCTIKAENAKSRREDTVPVNSGLAAALRKWREFRTKELGRKPKATERVVRVPRHLGNDQFRKDCAYAGIPTTNEEGRILDFYAATRHTFCTLLGRENMSVHKQRLLMRHRDLRTTMRYTHLETKDLVEGCERLPDFPEFEGPENVAIMLPQERTLAQEDSVSCKTAQESAKTERRS